MTFINFSEQRFKGLEAVDGSQLRECQAGQTHAGFQFESRKENQDIPLMFFYAADKHCLAKVRESAFERTFVLVGKKMVE